MYILQVETCYSYKCFDSLIGCLSKIVAILRLDCLCNVLCIRVVNCKTHGIGSSELNNQKRQAALKLNLDFLKSLAEPVISRLRNFSKISAGFLLKPQRDTISLDFSHFFNSCDGSNKIFTVSFTSLYQQSYSA